jgi:cell division protein FtsW (lipid II flippase)
MSNYQYNNRINSKTKNNNEFKNYFLFLVSNLNKKIFNNPVLVLCTLVLLISLFGIVTVGSAINSRIDSINDSFGQEFYAQIFGGFLFGLVLAFSIVRLGFDKLIKFKRVFIVLSLITLLYLALPTVISQITKESLEVTTSYFKSLPIRPIIKNGAVRWIKVFSLQFQPVELVKIASLLYFAVYFDKIKTLELNWDNLKRAIYIFVIIAFTIIIQPDLGSIVIIFATILTSLFLTRISFRTLISGLIILIIASSFVIAITPYRRDRLMGWVNNKSLVQGSKVGDNFLQVQKVKEAIVAGSMFGVGYTKGTIKNEIPEISSDAIVAIVFEEFGLFWVVLLVLLFAVFFVYSIELGIKNPNYDAKFVIIGIGSWIFYQAMWNITGITGLVPLKGLPLPFVSEGGTAVAVNIMAVGILISAVLTKKNYVTNN